MSDKITEIDGILTVEPALRFNSDHRVIPEPMENLFLLQNDGLRKALDLSHLFSQLYVLEFIAKLKDRKDRLATLIVHTGEAKGCLLELRDRVIVFPPEKYEKFAIHYVDTECSPYPFTAKNDLSALRAFMGLFKVWSGSINQATLNSFGVDSLQRFLPDEGIWQKCFPVYDGELEAPYGKQYRDVFTDYRELRDRDSNLLF